MVYDYKEHFSVAGKHCIVTGGAQGLSRGMAEGLLENGAEVVLMDVQKEKLQNVVDEYNAMGYRAYGVAGDLSKKEEIDRMFDEAMDRLGGKLDVMIPAVGIQRKFQPWEFPEDMWRLVIDINLNHVWFMCQKAIQVMKNQPSCENAVSNCLTNGFYEVTKNITYTNHAFVYILVCMSDHAWQQIPEELREPFMEGVRKGYETERQYLKEANETATVELKEKGVEFHEIDNVALQEAYQNVAKNKGFTFDSEWQAAVDEAISQNP